MMRFKAKNISNSYLLLYLFININLIFNRDKLHALNEESISNFEFEIILIPEENVEINFSSMTRTVKACRFPNEVIISTNFAKYIANISTMQLYFSVLTGQGIDKT